MFLCAFVAIKLMEFLTFSFLFSHLLFQFAGLDNFVNLLRDFFSNSVELLRLFARFDLCWMVLM